MKAVTDVVVTSTNAKQIVESFPKDEKIIFGPDRNLGNYINSVTNRNMLLWDGACHVHEQFSVEKIVELKAQHPEALVLAHPECKSTVLKLADVVGSTAALLKYAVNHPENTYIVATESGILHEMQKKCPQTTFIPAPPNDSTCGCNECSFMRLNTLEKLYECLKNESPEITVDPEIAEKAVSLFSGCWRFRRNWDYDRIYKRYLPIYWMVPFNVLECTIPCIRWYRSLRCNNLI